MPVPRADDAVLPPAKELVEDEGLLGGIDARPLIGHGDEEAMVVAGGSEAMGEPGGE